MPGELVELLSQQMTPQLASPLAMPPAPPLVLWL
jgi:hypothetical protein